MFNTSFMNLFADGEVTGYNPDADGDWFLLGDYTQDHNYWHSKILDALKVLDTSGNDCILIRGGVISDSGSGQIDISEGYGLAKDASDNYRLVYMPALTNIDIPTGWKDDRQLWVVGHYDYALGTPTRTHWNGDSYHYHLEDTYLGDPSGLLGGSTDDLFVDADPNAVADSVLCWGSLQMSAGDVFTDRSATERTAGYDGDGSGFDADTVDGYEATDLGYIADISMSPLTSKPNNLLCDGSAVSRSTYSALFDAITEDKGVVTITEANPAVVSLTGHGFATGDRIELTTTGTLPTNLVANTNYYVIYVGANSFQLATTLALAIAGTGIDSTGAVQSGTHSLRYVPFGISTSANFLVPDFQAVVPKGKGSQTINGNPKTGPAGVGVLDEDTLQGHEFSLLRGNGGINVTGQPYIGTWNAYYDTTTVMNGAMVTDGVNGTPRTGTQTKDNSIGMNFFIRYQ